MCLECASKSFLSGRNLPQINRQSAFGNQQSAKSKARTSYRLLAASYWLRATAGRSCQLLGCWRKSQTTKTKTNHKILSAAADSGQATSASFQLPASSHWILAKNNSYSVRQGHEKTANLRFAGLASRVHPLKKASGC
jgi:hypothetical protein